MPCGLDLVTSHRAHQHIFNYKLYLLREKRPGDILRVEWINIQYRNWFIWLGKLLQLHHIGNEQTLGNYMFRIWWTSALCLVWVLPVSSRGRYRFTKALPSRWTRFIVVCNRPSVWCARWPDKSYVDHLWIGNVLHSVTRWPLLTGQNFTGQSFAFQWGWEMFLASRFDPFNGEFLLTVLDELAGPYPSILLGFAGYFWAQSLHCQFLSFKNVAFFVFLRTAISSFTPLCFHLVLKRAPRFLSPVRHVDLSQGRARKAYWSMAVLGDRQKFFNLF